MKRKVVYTNIRPKFGRISPFNITPVKRAHKAHYRYQIKGKYKKGMDRHNTTTTTTTTTTKTFYLTFCAFGRKTWLKMCVDNTSDEGAAAEWRGS